MKDRLIYGGEEFISQYLDNFESWGDSSEEKYRSKIDESIWVRTVSDSMYLGYSLAILYKSPKPKVSTLIDLLFDSEFNDEAYSSALLLRDGELNEQIEFRELLISELKKIKINKLSIDQKARVQNIILFTELSHGENRREIIGKTQSEIEKDSAFYIEIAYEASKILENLEPSFFEKMKMKLLSILKSN